MRASLTEVTRVDVPAAVAVATRDALRRAGSDFVEGMVLWAGVQDGATFSVREAIVPEQEGIRGEHGLLVSVGEVELRRIGLHLYRSGLRLVAQIHSHPTEAFHSAVDDQYAIATALGSLSIVVPDFARGPFEMAAFATYRLTAGSWWRSNRPRWAPVPRAGELVRIG